MRTDYIAPEVEIIDLMGVLEPICAVSNDEYNWTGDTIDGTDVELPIWP